MGFFSKKSKKKATATTSTSTSKTPQKAPTTPAQTTEPVTPPTVEAAETPTVEADKVAATPIKKKHKTRISVTTPEKGEDEPAPEITDEDAGDPGQPGEAKEVPDEPETDDGATNQVEAEDGSKEGQSTESPVIVDGQEKTLDPDTGAETTEEAKQEDENVNKNLLGTFEGCDILPDSLKAMLPESWQQSNAAKEAETKEPEEPPKKMSYYNEEFACKFLEELTNVGFALVYHQPSLTIEEEKADWQGRSVTMNFKHGICNALEVLQPGVEWSTMGGGKDKKVLTRAVDLIDIHSIAVSSSDDMRDDLEAGELEEIQCFFTLTTKSGDIHVFEALNKEESNRIVLGVKNIAGRYSNLTVAGDPRVIVEFYDNSANPQEIVLPFDRAIVQVSHSFLG